MWAEHQMGVGGFGRHAGARAAMSGHLSFHGSTPAMPKTRLSAASNSVLGTSSNVADALPHFNTCGSCKKPGLITVP